MPSRRVIRFADEAVRLYAVERISQMSDDNIAAYMLQFVQALVYETHHLSPLGELLLERSLKNPYIVGIAYFWSIKSNLHMKTSYERYSLLLEQFLMLCGKFKDELIIQLHVNKILANTNEKVMNARVNKQKAHTKKVNLTNIGKEELFNLRSQLPLLFTFPIDPKVIIRDFDYTEFKVYSSKKLPLRVKGVNHQPGGDPMIIMFKNGDDLRQDILTLQLIFLMDKIWLENNLDFRMTPYKVIGTGDQQGYMEYVCHAHTLADIQVKYSLGAWHDDIIYQYFSETYPKQKDLEPIRETFAISSAGYCVATYLLGIGDRHPDNIMITEDGHLLHIDFGHFLGHYKVKFHYKRERDPFVFTPELAYFVSGYYFLTNEEKSSIKDIWNTPYFKKFEDLCCKGYNELRKHGHKLINIFLIMLSAGIPELKGAHEIEFLEKRLHLELTTVK